MKQLNTGMSIKKVKIKINKMTKVVEKNVAEIIVLIMFLLAFSSCYTINEMTMSDNTRMTRCTHVSR